MSDINLNTKVLKPVISTECKLRRNLRTASAIGNSSKLLRGTPVVGIRVDSNHSIGRSHTAGDKAKRNRDKLRSTHCW